jgi:hypothetical protein
LEEDVSGGEGTEDRHGKATATGAEFRKDQLSKVAGSKSVKMKESK